MKRPKIAILDVSDHVQLFEDDLFRKYMFTDDISECISYHVASNNWPTESLEDFSAEKIVKFLIENVDGVLITGSEDCCLDDSLCYISMLCGVIKILVEIDFPLFGVCFGAQAISRALYQGCEKLRNLKEEPEFGIVLIDFVDENAKKNPLFKGIDQAFYSSSSHSDCFLIDYEMVDHLLKSKHWKNQAYQVKNKLTYGLQFHPEIDHATSQEIFNTVTVPIIYDDNVKQIDMSIGKVMAKNFCEMILKHKRVR